MPAKTWWAITAYTTTGAGEEAGTPFEARAEQLYQSMIPRFRNTHMIRKIRPDKTVEKSTAGTKV